MDKDTAKSVAALIGYYALLIALIIAGLVPIAQMIEH